LLEHQEGKNPREGFKEKTLFRSGKDWILRTVSAWPRQFRLTLLSIAVGVVAGLGAILFDQLLSFALDMLHLLTGYLEPGRGSPATLAAEITERHSYWFLIIPALGGLASGILVYSLAPEAEGHGTDAMIEAFHQKGGQIRKRVPIVKIIASALTIGSGGSAGKEGPIAQIGSGFAAFLSSGLNLKPRDQRILVLAGAAGGSGLSSRHPWGRPCSPPRSSTGRPNSNTKGSSPASSPPSSPIPSIPRSMAERPSPSPARSTSY